MDYQKFLLSYKGSRLTSFVALSLLTAMIIINFILVISVINKRESIILIPPTLTEKVEVVKGRATEGYMKAWGLFLAELIGNVTPENITFIRATIEPLLSPKVYQQLISVIELQAKQISIDKITMSFEAKLVQYEPDEGIVFVTGESIISGPTGEQKRDSRTYEFIINMNGFKPLLDWVDTYKGNARTKKVRDRLKKSKKNQKTDF